MKVLHITHTYGGSGAGRGLQWLHEALLKVGIDSVVMAEKFAEPLPVEQSAKSNVGAVKKKLRGATYVMQCKVMKAGQRSFSFNRSPMFSSAEIEAEEADIIHLHWLGGMIKLSSISKLAKPVVWTVRDFRPFTGGCHLPGACVGYKANCSNCQMLKLPFRGLAAKQLEEQRLFTESCRILAPVAISRWMKEIMESSRAFSSEEIEMIYNCVDFQLFYPDPIERVGEVDDQSENTLTIGFGANNVTGDLNKGYKDFMKSVELLPSSLRSRLKLLVFGSYDTCQIEESTIPVTFLGRVDSQTLRAVYSTCDLMVFPSKQEAFGKVGAEAQACGCPIVTYPNNGLADVANDCPISEVADGQNPAALVGAILKVIDRSYNQSKSTRGLIRETAKRRFSQGSVASRYVTLYESMINSC